MLFHYLISRNSAHVVGSLSQGNSGGAKAGILPSRRSIVAAKKPSRGLSSGSHPGSAGAVRKASICQPVDELTASMKTVLGGSEEASSLVRGICAATATGLSADFPPPVGRRASRRQKRPARWLSPVGRVAIQR